MGSSSQRGQAIVELTIVLVFIVVVAKFGRLYFQELQRSSTEIRLKTRSTR